MTKKHEKQHHIKTTMRQSFATALRDLRKRKGLTHDDFSLVSSRSYLSCLEHGEKSPTLDKLDKLASVLQVQPATLIVLTSMNNEKIGLEEALDLIRLDLTFLNLSTEN